MKKLLVILIVVVIMVSCTRGQNKALADFHGDLDEIWQVQGDASKRLSDYHWFEDKYQSIQSHKASALMLANRGDDVSSEIMIINNWIGEYNSRSRQYDREMWKSSSLPQKIELITSIDELK
jgi:hypothetical protein